MEQLTKNQAVATSQEAVQNQNEPQLRDENAHNDKSVHGVLNPTYQAGLRRDAVQPDIEAERKKREDRKSGSAGMPRPISYAVFCLKKKTLLNRCRAHAEVLLHKRTDRDAARVGVAVGIHG